MSFLGMKKEHWGTYIARALLIIYVLIIIKLVVFKYPIDLLINHLKNWSVSTVKEGIMSANLIPFTSIIMYIRYYYKINGFANLFGNILVFVPYGMLLPFTSKGNKKWWIPTLYGFTLSTFIEVFQLLTRFGEFDIDDILLNTLGALLGFLVFKVLKRCFYELISDK